MKKNGRYKIKKRFLSILISFLCLLFCGTALTIPAEAKIWIKLADATKYQKYTMEKPVFPEETTTKKPSSSSSGSSSGAEKKPSVLDKKDCSHVPEAVAADVEELEKSNTYRQGPEKESK